MTTIPENNFIQFLNTDIDISSNVLTENLETFNRGKTFSRIFFMFSGFDSRKICANIEKTIKNLDFTLTNEQKNRAIENLNNMELKFQKNDAKATECSDTIERIKTYLNKSSGSHSPRTTAFVGSTSTTQKMITPPVSIKPIIVNSTRPQPIQQPSNNAIQQHQTSTQSRISKKMDSHTYNAQHKLVGAISRAHTKIEPGVVIEKSLRADWARIKEIEKENQITDRDRSTMPAYGQLTFVNGSYHFMSLKKEVKNSVPVLKYAYIRADEIEASITECKKSSQFDVGALLREQAKKMGIGYQG